MLSYSNVSVDGALLRVAKKADLPDGMVIRYGYPRTKELVYSKNLTSYQFVLQKNPSLAQEYQELLEKKKKLKRRSPERLEINNRINKIRDNLSEQEKDLIHKSAFVATTVSKATVDKAIYTQRFDVVIFDESSMTSQLCPSLFSTADVIPVCSNISLVNRSSTLFCTIAGNWQKSPKHTK